MRATAAPELPHVIPIPLRLRAFGALWVTGGLLGTALVGLGVITRSTGIVTCLAVAAVIWGAGMLLGLFDRFGSWYQHLAVVMIIWTVTLAYVLAGDPFSDIRTYYVWAVPYVSLFFGRRAMALHLLHVNAAFALGLVLLRDDGTTLFSTWLATTVMIVVIAVLVAWAASLAETSRARLQEQADHDALTGLPNRRLLMRMLERSLAEPGGGTAVVMLDLDSFKMVNDTHGHEAGDQLLVQVAARLSGVLAEGQLLARLGGDEFAVVISAPGGPGELPAQVGRLGDRLAELWAKVLPIGGGVYTSGSAGVAVAGPGDAAGDLLRRADVALYRAKAAGRGEIRHYDESLRSQVERRLELETALREAIGRGELWVAYQPLVGLADELMIGAEALCRWTHPVLGAVGPDEFIPVAEESGLIDEVTRFVVTRVLGDLAGWRAAGAMPDDFRVTVNVSPVMVRPGLADMFAAEVARSGLPPEVLSVELTESVLMVDDPAVGRELDRLRAAGHRLLLDDFGTGYSALSYLARLPVDALKLDRSFIPTGADEDQWAVVTAVIRMAQALRMPVVAEGVETVEQAERLRLLGCDRGQGWLFGRPEEAVRFAAELPAAQVVRVPLAREP